MQNAEGRRRDGDGSGRTAEEFTLVCFALNEEAAPFRRLGARGPKAGTLITGMGRRNAERSLRAFLERRRPDRVLSCGFAGGLNPPLKAGTVVFAAENNARLEAGLAMAGHRRVRFRCADRVAAPAEAKQALWQATGADAVEMESQVLGTVGAESGIPFAIVRVILDTAGEDLPLDFNRLMTPDLRMSYGRLACALLASPEKIGALLALQRRSKAAAEALARALAGVIEA